VEAADAARLIGIGAIISLHWVCFYGCIKAAGVAVAVLCLASVVLVTAVVEPLVFRRPLRAVELLLGVAVLIGVWLLVRVEASASGGAIVAGLGAAVAGATFGTSNGRMRARLSSDRMTVWELSAGAAWLGLATLLWPGGSIVAPSEIGAADWVWLTVLAVVCTALPWIWSLEVLTALTPYTVALSVTLEPVYSMAIAYLWFPDSERLTPGFYAGAALLIGLVMVDGQVRARAGPHRAPRADRTHPGPGDAASGV
jgi:drug/metabolite transporter (DMT)-like permease